MSNETLISQTSNNAGQARGPWRRLGGRFAAERWVDLIFVPLVVALLVIYFASVNQYFLTELNITNIFLQATVLAVVAFGVTFVILAGELDLSVGSGVALSSVVAAFVMQDTGSVLLGAIVAIGVGGAIGAINGLVVTKLEVPSFIATFGMLVIAHGIALAATNGGVVAGLPSGVRTLATGGPFGIEWIIWIAAAVFAALYFVQTQTAFGVRVFAVGGSRAAAHLSGVHVDRVKFMVFFISGITMGIGGLVLTGRLESGQPNGGVLLELDAIAAVVIGGTSIFGGRGSVARTLFGVLLIAVLHNGLDLEGVGDDLKQIIIGLVLIGATSVEFFRRQLLGRRRGLEPATAPSAKPIQARIR